jgi:GDP-4-dehydro-6-deoxy-D-mannose reductase
MRALVTGAQGFLGRRLVARLAADGWSVVCAVRTATDEASLAMGAGEINDFERLIDAAGPDVIFHLAGRMTGTARDLYEANTVLAANLLTAVQRQSARPVVTLVGSAAEYGRVGEDGLAVTENHPCQPLSDYGISKLAQTLTGLAHAQAGVPVIIGRVFNPLGPGMPQTLALPNFATQIIRGVDETLRVGDLDVERDFIDADEAMRLLAGLPSDPANLGQVFNICSGVAFRLRDLVERMIGMVGRPLRLVTDPSRLRANDVRRVVGSTVRLAAAGLAPKPPDMDRILRKLLDDAMAEGIRQ